MPFGRTVQDSTQSSSENRENPYLRFAPGERVVRIRGDEIAYWQYFMPVNGRDKGVGIIVDGDRYPVGPINKYMRSIGKEDPKYRGPSRRMLVNVFDRTPVLRDPEGRVVYADERGIFPFKGTPQASNRPMLMEFGKTVMDQLIMLDGRVRHPKTFEPLPIGQIDVQIITKGSGPTQTKMAMPGGVDELPEDVLDAPLYDLRTVARVMPDEAQERLLAGEEYTAVLKSLGWEPIAPLF